MRTSHILLLISMLLLSACVSDLPHPGSGNTVGSMPMICSTTNLRLDQSSPVYYVKSPDEMLMAQQCQFSTATVYFSKRAWSTLQRALATYPSNTAIRPLFDQEHPTYKVAGVLLATDSGYTILSFDGLYWKRMRVHTP